jgi:hypothetical protein
LTLLRLGLRGDGLSNVGCEEMTSKQEKRKIMTLVHSNKVNIGNNAIKQKVKGAETRLSKV